MTRVLFATLFVLTTGLALVGCRAEIEADDVSNISVPR